MRHWPVIAIVLCGCGRPATVEDCEYVVERIVQLELEQRNQGDPETVKVEADRTKQVLRESTMKDCVGKRITDGAMECVRNAKTSQEIVEDCFDGWQ
jgi:hypothetical protein